MAKIKLVRQKHDHACSIDCAAMVIGEVYGALIKKFVTNFHKHGIDDEILLNSLGNRGYSTLKKKIGRWSPL